ncbi:MAG: PQQ-binding-like beta-propeller repeat protein, partial [Pseudomonadales bacterium]|nr:PQQ-binding-like beta-propeller repeat protein [Pseudomonadales bacterium]
MTKIRSVLLSLVICSSAAHGQSLTLADQQTLLSPPEQDWLMWRGDYANSGFSLLDQINQSNVGTLEEVWTVDLEFGPNNPAPIVHDGVMYFLGAGDSLTALNASNGEILWRYKHEMDVVSTSKISVALHDDKVLMPTTDLHLV